MAAEGTRGGARVTGGVAEESARGARGSPIVRRTTHQGVDGGFTRRSPRSDVSEPSDPRPRVLIVEDDLLNQRVASFQFPAEEPTQ